MAYILHGLAPLGLPAPACAATAPGLLLPAAGPGLRRGWLLPAAVPGFGLGVAPQSHCPWPRARGGSSGSPPLASGERWLLPAAPDLGRGAAPPGRP